MQVLLFLPDIEYNKNISLFAIENVASKRADNRVKHMHSKVSFFGVSAPETHTHTAIRAHANKIAKTKQALFFASQQLEAHRRTHTGIDTMMKPSPK